MLHSPYGAAVHAPWALVIAARMRERYGVDVAAMHADDGIVLRLPDVEYEDGPPDFAEFVVLDPQTLEAEVTAEIGGAAIFAARFRECAARALLLPRRQIGKRQPLWQQRQRATQLLEVASAYPSFPIVAEAVRECLSDVFDVPALVGLMRELRGAGPSGSPRSRRRRRRRSPPRCCSATSRSSSTRATRRWPNGAPRR